MKRSKRSLGRRKAGPLVRLRSDGAEGVAGGGGAKPVIRVMEYDAKELVEPAQVEVAALRGCLSRWAVTWVNVDGVGDAGLLRELGEIFGLHPLVLDDIAHVQQRPKAEMYEEHLFVVARMAPDEPLAPTEQLSLVLGKNFVLTFQEGRPGDPFEPVRERLRRGSGRLRCAGADLLAYALLDAIIDAYFPVLEEIGERLETLEEEILERPERGVFRRVHDAKRELLALRRATWPLREALNALIREATPLITDETRLYLRDGYDHTVRIIDFIETYRELGSDLTDLYLSSVSQRMTEVMKVLTIIATIFIPLTFISSIYGMNFQTDKSPWNMPELTWYWGYPFALGLMAAVAAGLVGYFWWKGWLSAPATRVRGEREAEETRDPPPTPP